MNVAVIRGSGQLGSQVSAGIRIGPELDLAQPNTIATTLERVRPEGVILTAAYTNVDGCESNREHAFAVPLATDSIPLDVDLPLFDDVEPVTAMRQA